MGSSGRRCYQSPAIPLSQCPGATRSSWRRKKEKSELNKKGTPSSKTYLDLKRRNFVYVSVIWVDLDGTMDDEVTPAMVVDGYFLAFVPIINEGNTITRIGKLMPFVWHRYREIYQRTKS